MANNRFSQSDAQMKKGVLEMCVLYMISDEPTYGYDVMKRIELIFPEMNESTVYAILRRLHADGAAAVTIGETSGGPPRKYYFITDAGRELLEYDISVWRSMCDALGRFGF